MAAELLTGLSAFKSLFDMAKGLKDINDTAVRNAAVVELTEKIFAAQSAQATLIERVRDLEAEMMRLKAWDAEKQRYELKQWGDGAFARVLKESESNGEPIHPLCAACYDRGTKSIIHSNGSPTWDKHAWDCPTCKFSLKARMSAFKKPG